MIILWSFDSPQTGKHIAIYYWYWQRPPKQFRFPSNGKPEHKVFKVFEDVAFDGSFMFPFPSNGNTHSKKMQKPSISTALVCFHSLQTGNHIARGCRYYKVYAKARKMSNFFQRPLNAGRLHFGEIAVRHAGRTCKAQTHWVPRVGTIWVCPPLCKVATSAHSWFTEWPKKS